jgi:hypothetical protein
MFGFPGNIRFPPQPEEQCGTNRKSTERREAPFLDHKSGKTMAKHFLRNPT